MVLARKQREVVKGNAIVEVIQTGVPGTPILKPAKFGAARGFFSDSWNRKILAEHGIALDFVQDNHSLSAAMGAVRGLHSQAPRPGAEREALNIIADQIGRPTGAAEIAAARDTIARQSIDNPAKKQHRSFLRRTGCQLGRFRSRNFRGGGVGLHGNGNPRFRSLGPAQRSLKSCPHCCTTQPVFGIPRSDRREPPTDILKDLGGRS
ncbi:dTDP-4-dehydrorhamnose 3,5-epimerase family protein [Sulfitobacter sp. 1A12779]|uniref:dTDP-4-dehydrorhamnose 3,5-epimerase family protein n=1 Tax=Sulfitobacter sp. 1A12779 TaxID=3368599 RepID=UPI0037465B26